MRQDIPEGAACSQMPSVIGWGAIRSGPALRETYFTLCLFGKRLFIARGNYRRGKRYMRYWIA